MIEPTNEVIANSYELWGEYVDPDQTMSKAQFDALTIAERMVIISITFSEAG